MAKSCWKDHKKHQVKVKKHQNSGGKNVKLKYKYGYEFEANKLGSGWENQNSIKTFIIKSRVETLQRMNSSFI